MAGKKDKKANKDEKDSSLLPKTIGGIKVPKDARRQLADLAKHPAIADLIAAGLVALANRIKPPAPAEPAAPAPAPAPAPEPAPAAETPPPAAKPVVKRVRKPAAVAVPSESVPAPAPAPVAKAPPPRRGRKAADTPAKPRTRRTPPKTDG